MRPRVLRRYSGSAKQATIKGETKLLNQRSAIHIKVLSLLILLFVVAGSATAAGYQRREETRIAASASDALSIKDRVEVFEEVWEPIDEK